MLFTRRSPAAEASREGSDRLSPARLLEELTRGRIGLTVTSPGLNGRFVSLLLEVRADDGQLLMDELIPASGHQQVQPGMTLTVESALAGVPLSFRCEVLQVDRDAQGCFYRVTLPDRVSRRQRRQHFRVRADANRLSARLHVADGPVLDGEVADLSAAGLCIRVSASARAQRLTTGDQLACMLVDRGGETLETRIELRRVIEQPTGRGLLLGGRIIEASPAVERRLGKLVAELERDLARKRPRNQPSVS